MFRRSVRHQPKEMSLNISSLMDILTILLLFLILSFDSQEENIAHPEGFELPPSVSELPVHLAVKVSISHEEISVEDKVIVKLDKGTFRRRDFDRDQRVKALLVELQRQKAKLKEGSTVVGNEDESEIVYLECAKETKYKLLHRVMNTAAEAGFTKFRLAVHRQG